jgi:N-methylhydantoinase A
MSWRVGIDIGGTFTDLVALADDGRSFGTRCRRRRGRRKRGCSTRLRRAAGEVRPNEIALVAHASTIATNALLGQVHLELPRVAFITTEGFRDVLEIGRQNRSAIYDLNVTRPKPLARREDRLVVRERRGRTTAASSSRSTRRASRARSRRSRERGIKAVAVGLLHADADGAHERAVADALAPRSPTSEISLSSEIDPQYREYERFSTAVVNAALAPIVRAISTGSRAACARAACARRSS